MFKPTAFAAVLAAVAALAGTSQGQAKPEIAVSIKPVHSLVASVTRGVAEPYLLIPGSASPHTYSLKPSDAQALENADFVFWVGEDMETFMTQPLAALADNARRVPLAEAPEVTLLDIRSGDDWERHDDSHGENHGHGDDHAHDDGHDHAHGDHAQDKKGEHAHGDTDMHIWLDPANAKAMVARIVNVLSETDQANAETYEANGAETLKRLDSLEAELSEKLAPVQDKPYFVFHDAYQYFEVAFDLNNVGSITLNPEVPTSARRVREITEKIETTGANCIFAEPQFEPKLIDVVTEGTDVRSGVLDPLGADIDAGPDLYFALMRRNAEALVGCLSADS